METTVDLRDIVARVKALALPLAEARGLELFEVEYISGNRLLQVFLDRRNGFVDIDDCSAVSQQLSAELDRLDFIPHAYRLEVSSPGLDRPLRNGDDYRRFVGRRARLVLSQPLNGLAGLSGQIRECRQEVVNIGIDNGESLWVPLSQVKAARLEIDAAPGRSPALGQKIRKK